VSKNSSSPSVVCSSSSTRRSTRAPRIVDRLIDRCVVRTFLGAARFLALNKAASSASSSDADAGVVDEVLLELVVLVAVAALRGRLVDGAVEVSCCSGVDGSLRLPRFLAALALENRSSISSAAVGGAGGGPAFLCCFLVVSVEVEVVDLVAEGGRGGLDDDGDGAGVGLVVVGRCAMMLLR